MTTMLNDILEQLRQEKLSGDSEAVRQQIAALVGAYPDSDALLETLKGQLAAGEFEPAQQAHLWGLCAQAWVAKRNNDAAERCYEEALAVCPKDAGLRCSLGFLRYNQGKPELAETVFEAVLKDWPKAFTGWMGLGMTRRRLGKVEDAVRCYDKALEVCPESFEAWANRGNALRHLKRMEAAYRSYEKAAQLKPNYLPALKGQIAVLRDTNQPRPAHTLLDVALRLAPKDRELQMDLAWVYQEEQDFEAAKQVYQALLQDSPDSSELLQGLGNVAFRAGDTLTAADYYRKVASLTNDAQAYHNLGVALTRDHQYEAALEAHAQAIQQNPDYMSAHINHSLLHLLMGNLPEGLAEYEWRLTVPLYASRPLACPPWQGESLQGKTILIMAEQGFGDAFMYLRFLAQLKVQGARVVFECRPELRTLLAECPDIDTLIPSGDWEKTAKTCDYYCYLVSLPYRLKTTMETIPLNRPEQFTVSDVLQQKWRDRLSSGADLKIGITWASKADHPNAGVRSCGLGDFTALAQHPGARFYSFQKGDDPASRPAWPQGGAGFEDLGPELGDFADTVAAIACMDLVITVDTAVAHVAASLNKPTWVLLPYECDWRWFIERDDSPWYPTMRLFRQQRFGDWQSAFAPVAQALSQYQAVSAV